jgi:8-oxo-dGTP diphosphatase
MSLIDEILRIEHEYVKAVVGFLIRGDEILLGERIKVSGGLGQNTFAGPGGKVEPGETDDEAIKREIMEEIGVEITNYKRLGRIRFLNPGKQNWDFDASAYFVYEWKNKPQETDVMRPVWFKTNELPVDKMWEDNIDLLTRALKGEVIDMIYLYEDGKVTETKNLIHLKNT